MPPFVKIVRALAVMIEVAELDAPQRALAEPVVEEQPERDLVAKVGVRGDDRVAVVGRERRPIARARAFARSIASVGSPRSLPAAHLEVEEVTEDREVLVVGACGARAPLVLEELLEPLGADRRLQVGELEVSEVAGELVETRFVVDGFLAAVAVWDA